MHQRARTSIMIVLLLVIGGASTWWILNAREDMSQPDNVVRAVSRHFLLPADERPALLTIEDRSRVKSEFFRKAQNGDKVLVYKTNKLLILYRPGIDRIIEVGPVSIADISSQ